MIALVRENQLIQLRPAEEVEFLDDDSALAKGDNTPEEITPELLTTDGAVLGVCQLCRPAEPY